VAIKPIEGRNMLIDCGAHFGEASELFLKRLPKGTGGDWVFFGFEPNPNIDKYMRDVLDAFLFKKAVYIEDGELEFYLSKKGKTKQQASTMRNKISGKLDINHPVKVPCVDFSRWISTCNPEVYKVVLMDIEGAEYDVLERMVEYGTINNINVLYVEFHAHKLHMDVSRHIKLIHDLQQIKGLELHGDYKPNQPERAFISTYLSKDYLKLCGGKQ